MASFKLRNPKSDKETTIFFTMYFKDEQKNLQYPTGVKIHPEDWDPKSKRPKRKVQHTSKVMTSQIRRRLNTIEDFAAQTAERYKLLGERLTMESLREKLNVKLKKTKQSASDFFQVYKEFQEYKKNGNGGNPISNSTYMRYEYNRRLLKEFEEYRRKEIKLKFISKQFYGEFMNFCIQEKEHSANTLNRNMGLFKTFLRWCHENGKTYNTEFLKFKNPPKQPTMEVALTLDQLTEFYRADLSGIPHLDRVKDLFVFGCLTGQRFGNYSRISINDIIRNRILVPDDKDKTKILNIPLVGPAREILEKYEGKLPMISNQKFNKYIKKAFKKLGYDSMTKRIRRVGREPIEETFPFYMRISSHTARRSFITIMQKKKVPQKTIMSITGHKSLSQFNVYYKTDDDYAEESMNDVFGDI